MSRSSSLPSTSSQLLSLASTASAEQAAELRGFIYPPHSFSPSQLQHLLALLRADLQLFLRQICYKAEEQEQEQEECCEYIWNREEPRLDIVGECCVRIVLSGHGVSVEDEWLVVHLLRRWTEDAHSRSLLSSFPHPHPHPHHTSSHADAGLAARVEDEDGELVCIEGAQALPHWVDPANASRRCWLYSGHVHLIPPHLASGHPLRSSDDDDDDDDECAFEMPAMQTSPIQAAGPLDTNTALDILRAPSNHKETLHQGLTRAIGTRMPSYPSPVWARQTQHCTLVYAPSTVASVLNKDANLMGRVARAFLAREGPADARVAIAMKVFGPATVRADAHQDQQHAAQRKEGLVLVRVRMTKHLYALLTAARYYPPKIWGECARGAVQSLWEARTGQVASRGHSESGVGEREARRRDLGIKLSTGLELLYEAAMRRGPMTRRMFDDPSHSSICQTQEYQRFLNSLTALGYFGQEISGSQRWGDLEKEAVRLWRQALSARRDAGSEEGIDGRETDEIVPLVRSVLDHPLSHAVSFIDDSLSESVLSTLEDDEAFLLDSEEQQDGQVDAKESEREAEEELADEQLKAFAKRLEEFVGAEGEMDGAIFEDEMEEDDEEEEERDEKGITLSEARRRVREMSMQERQRAVLNNLPLADLEGWGGAGRSEASTTSKGTGKQRAEAQMSETVLGSQSSSDETATAAMRIDAVSRDVPAPPSNSVPPLSSVHYDGASDSDSDSDRESESESTRQSTKNMGSTQERAHLASVLDLTPDEEVLVEAQEVWGHEGPNEEEDLNGFLQFAKKELGLRDEEYEEILNERRRAARFVPERMGLEANERAQRLKTSKASTISTQQSTGLQAQSAREKQGEKKMPLDGFESLMRSLDAELEKHLSRKKQADQRGDVDVDMDMDDAEPVRRPAPMRMPGSSGSSSSRGASDIYADADAHDDESDEEETLSLQDQELLDKLLGRLETFGPASNLLDRRAEGQAGPTATATATTLDDAQRARMLQEMMSSLEAQGAAAGPVGNLARRLGATLPRGR
ncbi:MADS box transcription factor [Ceraceosorus bombacis]|uniref:MADS box transcription factor n=1 Tax=Ceraceosorus bombacis TaxID=401625 RepID=A0A0P1BKB3_9BASI|nr:MADS box transcription factor [Ceraceosorus bombacis]